jgi:hypothetical protein
MKPILPKTDYTGIEQEWKKRKRKIENKYRSYGYRTVRKWERRVGFKVRTRIIGDSFIITAWPIGPNAWLWWIIDRGTRRRKIVPKKPGGVLVFRSDYQPRTQPGGTYGGPGRATGNLVFAKSVWHRLRARHFVREWQKWARGWFPQAVSEIVTAGLKHKVNREA